MGAESLESLTTVLANGIAIATGVGGAILGGVGYRKSQVTERRLLYEPWFRKHWQDVQKHVSKSAAATSRWLERFDFNWWRKKWILREKFDGVNRTALADLNSAFGNAQSTLGSEYDKKFYRAAVEIEDLSFNLLSSIDKFNEEIKEMRDLRFAVGIYNTALSDKHGLTSVYKDAAEKEVKKIPLSVRASLTFRRHLIERRLRKLARKIPKFMDRVRYYERVLAEH